MHLSREAILSSDKNAIRIKTPVLPLGTVSVPGVGILNRGTPQQSGGEKLASFPPSTSWSPCLLEDDLNKFCLQHAEQTLQKSLLFCHATAAYPTNSHAAVFPQGICIDTSHFKLRMQTHTLSCILYRRVNTAAENPISVAMKNILNSSHLL